MEQNNSAMKSSITVSVEELSEFIIRSINELLESQGLTDEEFKNKSRTKEIVKNVLTEKGILENTDNITINFNNERHCKDILDRTLDKISKFGKESLTKNDKLFLKNMKNNL